MVKTIKVLIAEDHTIVRQGLARLLSDQPWLEVIGQAVPVLDRMDVPAFLADGGREVCGIHE